MSRFLLFFCCCLGLGQQKAVPPHHEILVAAAADLKFAMDSLVKVFSAQTSDVTVKLVYGSSGNFFEQISNDAPFDLFFSADLEYPQKLEQLHKTISAIKPYGTGQIV